MSGRRAIALCLTTLSCPARLRPSRGILAAATLLLCGVAGCGSSTTYLNVPTMERAIAQSFLVERHVYTRVACPTRIPQAKGRSFQCNALFNVGSYPVPVTEVDGNGHVSWNSRAPVVTLDPRRVEAAIQRASFAQRGAQSKVTCPSQVLQHKGLTFKCTAVVKIGTSRVPTGKYTFKVTESDDAGHVTFRGL